MRGTPQTGVFQKPVIDLTPPMPAERSTFRPASDPCFSKWCRMEHERGALYFVQNLGGFAFQYLLFLPVLFLTQGFPFRILSSPERDGKGNKGLSWTEF